MRNCLSEMVYALTSAYDRKDYENLSQGIGLQTNIGKLFSIFSWGLDFICGQAELIKRWENIDYAQGSVLDRYGANFGVARGSANDALYRLFIRAKMIAQLSGGEEEAILKAVAEIFNIEYTNVQLEDFFPSKKKLHIYRKDISPVYLDLIGQIGCVVKRTMAAGVGLQVALHFEAVESLIHVGVTGAIISHITPVEQLDNLSGTQTLHAGGKPQTIAQQAPVEQLDNLSGTQTLRAGGKPQTIAQQAPVEQLDNLYAIKFFQTGVKGTSIINAVFTECADKMFLSQTFYAGGQVSSLATSTSSEQSDNLKAERSSRYNGLGTIVSIMPGKEI